MEEKIKEHIENNESLNHRDVVIISYYGMGEFVTVNFMSNGKLYKKNTMFDKSELT